MKKCLLFAVAALSASGAFAVEKVLAETDFTTTGDYYFWKSDATNAELKNGALVVTNEAVTANFWDIQYIVADSFSLTADTEYTVDVKIKGFTGNLHYNLGTWSSNTNGGVDVAKAADWQNVVFKVVAAADASGDAHLLLQSGDFVGTYSIASVKISYNDEAGETPMDPVEPGEEKILATMYPGNAAMIGWGDGYSSEVVTEGSREALKISHPAESANFWDAQFAYDYEFEAGTTYYFTFDVKGDAGTITSGFQQTNGYIGCGNFDDFTVTPEWNTVTIKGTAATSDNGDPNRWVANIGSYVGDIYLSNVKLYVIEGGTAVVAGDDFEYEGLWYTVIDPEAKTCRTRNGSPVSSGEALKAGNTFSGDLSIPSTVFFDSEEFTVVEIGSYGFSAVSTLNSVAIPESVTKIGLDAFYECSRLRSVSLPNSLREIGSYAFNGCSSLTEISLPESLTSLSDNVFGDCSSLRSVEFTNSLTSIGEYAFSGCSHLTEVQLPDAITSLGNSVFSRCTNLEKVNIPSSLQSAGTFLFLGCEFIDEVDYKVETPLALSQYIFAEDVYEFAVLNMPDTPLATISATVPWNRFNKIIASDGSIGFVAAGDDFEYEDIWYTVIDPEAKTCKTRAGWHENASDLPGNTFSGELTIPNIVKLDNTEYTVIGIGWRGFFAQDGITSVKLPQSITTIDDLAFYSCSGITDINLPQSLISIGNEVFGECNGITTIEIPYQITTLGKWLFRNCSGLTSIKLPPNLSSIGDEAFYGCTSLKDIHLPETIVDLGNHTFAACTSLLQINFPQAITSIGEATFAGCTGFTELNLPPHVVSIGASAFQKCTNIKSISFPDVIDTIGKYAFEGCSSLISIVLPESILYLGEETFSGCASLTDVSLPKSVTTIGEMAFFGSNRIQDVTYNAETPISALKNIFDDSVYGNATLNMPNASLVDIQSTTPWNKFGHIIASDGSVGFVAAGDDFEYEGIWYTVIDTEAKTCKTIKIYEEVDGEFVSGYHLSGDLSIPPTVSYSSIDYTVIGVGENSFDGCSELTSVFLPNTVRFIENQAFFGCTGLTSIILPSSLEEIGTYFLASCSALTEVTIPEKVTVISWGAFDSCRALAKVTLPEGLTDIETNAFIGCYGLVSINMPSSLKRIDASGFNNCALTSIELPGELEYIGRGAFMGNPLVSVSIPASLNEIGETPFSGCHEIKEVTYLAETPVSFEETFFDSLVYMTATLNAPNATVADIRTTTPWSLFHKAIASDGSIGFVVAGDDFEYQGIWYTVLDPDDKTAKTKDEGNYVVGDVVIPSQTSDGQEVYTVVEIGQDSFRGSEGLLSVTLPASIQTIGTNAFAGCRRLTSFVWTRHERLSRNVIDEIGNPNILLYVDSIRFAPEGMGANVVADGVCEYLDVTPGHAFTPLTPFTALQSRMVKEFTQKTYIDICAGWETIVLPFEANEVYAENIGSPLTPFAALTDMQAQRPFWLYEADEAGLWKEASGIRAGVPCIISMPNNPGYVSGYSIEGDVVFSSSEPQRITPETTAPYAVDWASGRQFRSLWLPLLKEEAEDAMGLNVGMSWLTGDDGELLPPGSAFHAGVTPKPLEAYVTRIGSERAMKVMGGQSGVLPVIADGSLEIRVEDGALLLRSAANRKEFVFTPEGAILRMLELKAGETIAINDLIPGIYIVAGRKVILR